jgi:histidinol-phosphate aminotransferase
MVRIRPVVEEMEGYVGGRSLGEAARVLDLDPRKVVKLNSNESPLGPSPRALRALRALRDLHRYPPPRPRDLVAAIARRERLPEGCVAVCGGSDAAVETLLRLVLEPGDRTVAPVPTFPYYAIATRLAGGVPVAVPRDRSLRTSARALLARADRRTRIVWLASPNNPTGDAVDRAEIRALLEGLPDALVVVDEAYGEFAGRTVAPWVRRFGNLVVLRTFSKAYGLAGVRLGYALLPEPLRPPFDKAATPFPVSAPAVAAGLAALADRAHLRRTVETVRRGRALLRKRVPFTTYPSEANFVLADLSPLRAPRVAEALFRKGVLVRDCSRMEGCGPGHLRITVGTAEQNRRVVAALRAV